MSVAFPPSRLPAFFLLNWDFRLFPLMVLTMALAACGGGSGDSQMTSHNDKEPIVDSPPFGNLHYLTTTEDSESQKIVKQSEDDKDSKTEEQQQIIIVNQEEKEPENEEEQQIIVVNVQPEEEESESEEEQELEEEQQITIIEEPEPTYIPPAEEEPRYSASISSTDFTNRTTKGNYTTSNHRGVGDINGFSYWFSDDATGQTFTISQGATGAVRNLDVGGLLENSAFDPTGRGPQTVCDPVGSSISSDCQTINNYLFPKPNSGILTATYSRSNGFSGIYSYKGRSGNLTGDVNLLFSYGARSDDKSVGIDGTIGKDLIMNGDNFGTIVISGSIDPKTGTFTFGDNPYNPVPYFADSSYKLEYKMHTTPIRNADGKVTGYTADVNSGTGSVVGSFSNDGSAGNSKSNLPNHIAGEIRMEGFYQGSDATNSQHNKLVGVFVGDKK